MSSDKEIDEKNIYKIETEEHDDGSATIRIDIDNELQKILMKQGLNYLIEEMKMHDKVVVLEPNEFSGEATNWELSADEYNALFHFGFISAVKAGIEKENL